jgi:hypothetical protein
MQLIKCTKKLQKEMGLKEADLVRHEPDVSLLGPWHANLIHIDRKKCVLFINDKTLFNFLVPDVVRSQLRDIDKLFRNWLECILSEEGFVAALKEKILSEYQEIGYADSSSKSVLGSMNDLAFHYKYLVLSGGGVHSYQVPEIIRKLNRMPMGALGYQYSIDALKALYGLVPQRGQ